MVSCQDVTNNQQYCVENQHVPTSMEQSPASLLMSNVVLLAAFWESEACLELSVF